jgi:phage repressor protein C with HTH and peptisase S24 domain
MIAVRGDSMIPTLWPGQRCMVDTNDRIPSPPGVFVVWDGMGLVLKRLELIPGSGDPMRVRIMSDNPKYTAYERTLDEAHINGRVVGVWARM